jgi:hypothetical protein
MQLLLLLLLLLHAQQMGMQLLLARYTVQLLWRRLRLRGREQQWVLLAVQSLCGSERLRHRWCGNS